MSYPRRGDVYWVRLDPTIGTEIGKTRPALIISNDVGNQYSGRVIVAPISSAHTGKVYPFEVLISAGEAGLTRPSKILLDQIRCIDKQRLAQCIGTLSPNRLADVDLAIRLSVAV